MRAKAAGTAPIAILAAALACALARPAAGDAADPGTAGPPEDTRFGLDAHAHVHAGSEGYLGESGPDEGAPAIWLLAALGSTEARAYRLVARLGLALSARGQSPRAGHPAANGPIRYYRFGLSECSLRLRFGGAEADDGFLAGLAGLQGNPDAILFGDYLARFGAYPAIEIRRAPEWDSLGATAPRVFGMRLAIGRRDGPARLEGWVVRETDSYTPGPEFSLVAFVSGRAPRGVGWGLGWSSYRAFALGGDASAIYRPARDYGPYDSSAILVVSGARSDTVQYYAIRAPDRFSARLSLDFAALFGLEGSENRYGGLFGEAAVLGWEDYPPYYTDRADRLAWTAGARLPTRGWPDVCAIQFEWRHETGSPYPDYYRYWMSAVPVPGGSAVPAGYADAPPRRPSPARMGLFLAERFGRAFEAQARLLVYETAAGGYPAGKRMRALGRIVYRVP